MKLVQSILLICLILFANLNLFVYQNWCHGENVGYTVNSKKFNASLQTSSSAKEIPSFKRDLCCKDVLIKSNEISAFSLDPIFQLSFYNSIGISSDLSWNILALSFNQKVEIPLLYSNPPPSPIKLYRIYCRYTYYCC
ncbi:MAG: hypothetical protein LBP34_03125 [Flavobacteriaceae bacterium]|jgi:hypothetical protein|nr:hypothetical protein [Flavobacteriaceae bacterium]